MSSPALKALAEQLNVDLAGSKHLAPMRTKLSLHISELLDVPSDSEPAAMPSSSAAEAKAHADTLARCAALEKELTETKASFAAGIPASLPAALAKHVSFLDQSGIDHMLQQGVAPSGSDGNGEGTWLKRSFTASESPGLSPAPAIS